MLNFYDEINEKHKIEIYVDKEKELYLVPNSYYINSYGLLYNCFGKDGHKEANLKYAYKLIKDNIYEKKYISLIDNKAISLEVVLKREIKNLRRILSFNGIASKDTMNYLHLNCFDLNDPLVIKLIIGVITSKICLLKKFIELKNNSLDAKADLERIIKETNDDLSDVLVRYLGFHKINSTIDKTITTSSLNLYSFKEYLDRGYSIDIVPKIVLSKYSDIYKDMVVGNFLNKYPEYSGKIKAYK